VTARAAARRGAALLREDRLLTIAAQAGILVLNLVASVVIARSIGPDATGAYAVVARTSAFLLSFVSMSYAHGLAQAVARHGGVATSPSWSGALVLAVPQTLVGGVLMAVVFTLVVRLPEAHAGVLVGWYAVSLGAQFVITAGQHVLRGLLAFAAFNANRLCQASTWTAGCLVLLLLGSVSLATIGAAWLVSQVVTLLLVLLAVRRRGVRAGARPAVASPLRFGLRAHVGIVGRDTAPYLDQLLVAGLVSTAALGLYVPASTFSGLVLVIGVAMSFVIQPRISAAPEEHRARVSLRLVGQAAWASLAVGLLCATTSRWIVPFFYGAAYEDSGRLGVLLSLAVVFDSVSMAIVCALMGLGLPGRASAVQALGTVFVVVNLVVFLRQGGVAEAPLAMLLAYATTCAVALGYLWRCVPRHGRRLADLVWPVAGARGSA
jgi:O-antigen/teichoic acid export membrane protein